MTVALKLLILIWPRSVVGRHWWVILPGGWDSLKCSTKQKTGTWLCFFSWNSPKPTPPTPVIKPRFGDLVIQKAQRMVTPFFSTKNSWLAQKCCWKGKKKHVCSVRESESSLQITSISFHNQKIRRNDGKQKRKKQQFEMSEKMF